MRAREEPAARIRAREIFIASKGQEKYPALQLQLKLEGHGDITIDCLRHWRQRDIKAGYVNLDELATEYEQIGKQVEKVAKSLSLPPNMSTAEKVEAARLADLEDTHERMLRVVNVSAERLTAAIPGMAIEGIAEAVMLGNIANSIADSSIKLRLALVQVREQSMKLISASASADGRSVEAELIPPTKPAGLAGAIGAFRKAG